MRPDRYSTVNNVVEPVKREYAHIGLLNFCEVGRASVKKLDELAISLPTVAMANGTVENILVLTDICRARTRGCWGILLRMRHCGSANREYTDCERSDQC